MALGTALLAAAAVSVPMPSTADDVAYAAGRVLWTQAERGQVTVTTTRLDGAPPSVVTLPTPSGETSLAANATGFVVAVRSGRFDRVVRGGHDGSLQTVLECAERVADPADLTVVAGATGFAIGGARCRDGVVWTVPADGAATPVAGVPGASIAYAEPYLAFADLDRVSILNLADGSRRSLGEPYARPESPFAVLHDGSLVVGLGTHTPTRGAPLGIYVWPPGARRPLLVTTSLPDGPLLAASPGAILYEPQDRERSALALTGLGATGIAPVGAPGAGEARWPLAFDGPTAAFQNFSCQGVLQVTVVTLADRDSSAVDGCPVRLLRGDIRFDARGRGTARVVCPNGCRTQLRLRRVPTGTGCVEGTTLCPIVAEARLRLPARPDAQRVRVRLTRALRGRRVRAFAELTYGEFRGPELDGFPRRTLLP